MNVTVPDDARRRHARQLLLAEVGERGQARLIAHEVAVHGDPRAVEVAALYLSRAGVSVHEGHQHELAVPGPDEVSRLAGREGLREAAAFVAGAFSAVEELKRALGVGAPGQLPAVLFAAEGERS